MTQRVTIELPDELYYQLKRTAGLMGKPIASVVEQSVRYTVPPLVVEHLIPKSLGGADDESNLWISCRILGIIAIGRAAISALFLNADLRVRSRKLWVEVGYHPPD
jgi:hypothetical protein